MPSKCSCNPPTSTFLKFLILYASRMLVTLFPGHHVHGTKFFRQGGRRGRCFFQGRMSTSHSFFFPTLALPGGSADSDSDGRLLSHDFCLLSCSQVGFFETFIYGSVREIPSQVLLNSRAPHLRNACFLNLPFTSARRSWCVMLQDEFSRLRALIPHASFIATPPWTLNLTSSPSADITVGVRSREDLEF